MLIFEFWSIIVHPFRKTKYWEPLMVIKDKKRRIEDLTPQEVNICISSFYL